MLWRMIAVVCRKRLAWLGDMHVDKNPISAGGLPLRL
jgi:hypothetical protein